MDKNQLERIYGFTFEEYLAWAGRPGTDREIIASAHRDHMRRAALRDGLTESEIRAIEDRIRSQKGL